MSTCPEGCVATTEFAELWRAVDALREESTICREWRARQEGTGEERWASYAISNTAHASEVAALRSRISDLEKKVIKWAALAAGLGAGASELAGSIVL